MASFRPEGGYEPRLPSRSAWVKRRLGACLAVVFFRCHSRTADSEKKQSLETRPVADTSCRDAAEDSMIIIGVFAGPVDDLGPVGLVCR